ncbi:MAG TPA: hypothetical protein VJM69_04655, partial [Dehalococcoidia bacterium]|nr:hypothetical protein [Dehalococcoidia bacterium]
NVPQEIDVGFLGHQELHHWWDVTVMAANMPPDWRRFRYLADRYLKDAGLDGPEEYAAFLAATPALLAEALAHVGPAQVQAVLERSVEAGLKAMREYLGCN